MIGMSIQLLGIAVILFLIFWRLGEIHETIKDQIKKHNRDNSFL